MTYCSDKRSEIEKQEDWRNWIANIPTLTFDPDWQIRIIPPVSGALVRFQVTKGKAWVSVYLDVFDALGFVGTPYWEVYPVNDDTARCLMNETDELLDFIRQSLEQQL